MKCDDLLKLVRREYYFEKIESAVSIFVQSSVYFLTLLLFSVSYQLSVIFDQYLSKIYSNGYLFRIKGFMEEDMNQLTSIGFYDIHLDRIGVARIDSIENIWLYKCFFLLKGKDIWSAELEEALNMLMFCKLLFFMLGGFMLLLLLNNISNSIFMKLNRRWNYIIMLNCLGCSMRLCKKLFRFFFLSRYIISLIIAAILYIIGIFKVNRFLTEKLSLPAGITFHNGPVLLVFTIASFSMLLFTYNKTWRAIHEYQI